MLDSTLGTLRTRSRQLHHDTHQFDAASAATVGPSLLSHRSHEAYHLNQNRSNLSGNPSLWSFYSSMSLECTR